MDGGWRGLAYKSAQGSPTRGSSLIVSRAPYSLVYRLGMAKATRPEVQWSIMDAKAPSQFPA